MPEDKAPHYVRLYEAMERVAKEIGITVSRPTMRKWMQDRNMGKKIGSHWFIEMKELDTLIESLLGGDK